MLSAGSRISNLKISAVLALAVIFIASVQAELKTVHVLFRHGDRTPDNNGYEMYPNDPYLHYDFHPEGLGQLTNQGKRREYNLGLALREKYGKFLGDVTTPGTVSALSSDYDRTKMSLQLVLASLLPPADSQKWHPNLNWQPTAANYLRRLEDNVFLADECPLYLAEYNRVLNSPEGQRQLSEFSAFMKRMTKLTGKNISTPLDMFYLYHTLMSEYSMNLSLPDWAYTIFPYGTLWNGTVMAYRIGSYNTLLKRLYGGPLLRIMTENMVALKNRTMEDPRKMYLYSGHETNIASLLHALDLYYNHVPQYSSALMLELHELKNNHYVKIQHYLGIPPVIAELRMPNCDVLCPLDKFLELTAELIPSDEELICDKTLTKDYANYKPQSAIETMTYNLIRTSRNVRNE